MSKSRLEKFLHALCSLDSSDLPNPLSRIEELYKCLVTGEEPPTFEPLSRVEKYIMAILGVYDTNELPNPISRVEVLLYKLATGDDNLDDVKSFLSEHEELLAEIIRNGGVGGNINIEHVLYTLSTEFNTLYNTAEKPVKSAILKGNTKYRDIDTGDILDTFDETKNLELVSVKVPVLTTTGKNLFDGKMELGSITPKGIPEDSVNCLRSVNFIKIKPSTLYKITNDLGYSIALYEYDSDFNFIKNTTYYKTYTALENTAYIKIKTSASKVETDLSVKFQIEEGYVGTSYEPFKSNILTVNEEVELRGIGDVQDELNLLTGEVTERIGEIVLDGSESWISHSSKTSTNVYRLPYSKLAHVENRILCDKLTNAASGDVEKIAASGDVGTTSYHAFYIALSKTKANTLSDFKSYLSENPLVVQYQLETPTVKTVDLSVVDQDGNDTKLSTFNDITHVTLSSEGLIPEAELEVVTKNEEVLNTMRLEMDDISATQTTLEEMSDTQSENVDATMIAATEIYEELL